MDKGYSHWHNIIEKENRHRANSYHQKAIKQGMELIQRFEIPENTIPVQMDKTKDSRLKVYPVILKCIARTMHLLAKQWLPLRGHRDEMIDSETGTNRNPGDFIAFLHEIAQYCPELENHLKNPLMKNAIYTSPKSQNEMIDVIGINTIRQQLINEIKDAKFHAVMADEVTSLNDELLSICFRYVDGQKDIREVFLQFLELKRITGSEIGAALLSFYKSSGIDMKQCRGKCYDVAPNMQSEKSGTTSWILRESNNAITNHYCSHNLNLSLASTCKLHVVDNVLEKYKSLQIYFNSSPKREKLLEYVVSQNNEMNDSKRSILLGMCKTRWCERDVSYERFNLAMPYIMEALEVMNGMHADINQLDETYSKGWSSKDKQETSSYLHGLSNFIIGLIMCNICAL